MARKPNTETAKLLEVRANKIEQITQFADQMQHIRDTVGHLQSDIEKLDFALTVLDPSHVPMDAKSSTSGRLLIEAQPAQQVETPTIDATASQATVGKEAVQPKRQGKAPAKTTASKAPAKKTASVKPVTAKPVAAKPVAAKKAAPARKGKNEPVPQTAVDAAEKISGSSSGNDKVSRARAVVNAYVADFKPTDEIEAALKKASKRGLTVDGVATAILKVRPLEGAGEAAVFMQLKNRISSQIAHMMKKGVVGKGKPDGETLTHYFFEKKVKATPSKATKTMAEQTEVSEPAIHAVDTPAEVPAEQVA
jgi:hypothetical protein